jgi:hypothetical protein
MLSLSFYRAEADVPERPELSVDFTTDGFAELVTVGLFKLPHVDVTADYRGIDLRIFRIRVEEMILSCKIKHPRRTAIINAVRNCKYLVGNQ